MSCSFLCQSQTLRCRQIPPKSQLLLELHVKECTGVNFLEHVQVNVILWYRWVSSFVMTKCRTTDISKFLKLFEHSKYMINFQIGNFRNFPNKIFCHSPYWKFFEFTNLEIFKIFWIRKLTKFSNSIIYMSNKFFRIVQF